MIESNGNFLWCGIKTDILKLEFLLQSNCNIKRSMRLPIIIKNVGHRPKYFEGLCLSV